MEQWFVELKADDAEAEVWQDQFPEHGDPRVSRFDVPDGHGGTKKVTGIASNDFTGRSDAQEVDTSGRQLIDEMRGWVFCSPDWSLNTEQAATGAVYHLGEDGQYRGHHFIRSSMVMASVRVSGVGVVVSSNGEVRIAPPSPTAGRRLITDGTEGAGAALRYLGQTKANDWNSLYQAFDALGKVDRLNTAVRLAQTFSQHRKHTTRPMDGQPMPFHEGRAGNTFYRA